MGETAAPSGSQPKLPSGAAATGSGDSASDSDSEDWPTATGTSSSSEAITCVGEGEGNYRHVRVLLRQQRGLQREVDAALRLVEVQHARLHLVADRIELRQLRLRRVGAVLAEGDARELGAVDLQTHKLVLDGGHYRLHRHSFLQILPRDLRLLLDVRLLRVTLFHHTCLQRQLVEELRRVHLQQAARHQQSCVVLLPHRRRVPVAQMAHRHVRNHAVRQTVSETSLMPTARTRRARCATPRSRTPAPRSRSSGPPAPPRRGVASPRTAPRA